jgi:hypothetical protein
VLVDTWLEVDRRAGKNPGGKSRGYPLIDVKMGVNRCACKKYVFAVASKQLLSLDRYKGRMKCFISTIIPRQAARKKKNVMN